MEKLNEISPHSVLHSDFLFHFDTDMETHSSGYEGTQEQNVNVML